MILQPGRLIYLIKKLLMNMYQTNLANENADYRFLRRQTITFVLNQEYTLYASDVNTSIS